MGTSEPTEQISKAQAHYLHRLHCEFIRFSKKKWLIHILDCGLMREYTLKHSVLDYLLIGLLDTSPGGATFLFFGFFFSSHFYKD